MRAVGVIVPFSASTCAGKGFGDEQFPPRIIAQHPGHGTSCDNVVHRTFGSAPAHLVDRQRRDHPLVHIQTAPLDEPRITRVLGIA